MWRDKRRDGSIGLSEAEKQAIRDRLAVMAEEAAEILKLSLDKPQLVSRQQLQTAKDILKMAGVVTQAQPPDVPRKVLLAMALVEASGLLDEARTLLAEHEVEHKTVDKSPKA